MSSDDATLVSDPYSFFGLIQNPDGSITRPPDLSPISCVPTKPIPVLTKDIPINQQTKTWARLYIPRPEPDAPPPTKLPLIVYYHGGGHILGSAATLLWQKFCCNIVHKMPAMMVSVDYRLAPEHRLPTAYDDCFDALNWLKTTDEEWLIKYADFSNCFLMGTSAGGNITYHVGVRAAAAIDQLKPLKIQGLILHHPFLGGVERTPSEISCLNDKLLPVYVSDMMWGLALPDGVDRDHEYCNPVKHIKEEFVEKVKADGWKILVTGCTGDSAYDRQIGIAKTLKETGVDVTHHFITGGYHGIDLFEDSWADIFYDDLNKFLLSF